MKGYEKSETSPLLSSERLKKTQALSQYKMLDSQINRVRKAMCMHSLVKQVFIVSSKALIEILIDITKPGLKMHTNHNYTKSQQHSR